MADKVQQSSLKCSEEHQISQITNDEEAGILLSTQPNSLDGMTSSRNRIRNYCPCICPCSCSCSIPSYKVIGFLFDVIAATVSLLDLATDLIILMSWYNADRMIFFWLSVSILVIAQLSYICIFHYNHRERSDNLFRIILSVLITVPLSPVLSLIFYFVADKHSTLRRVIDKWCCCVSFDWGDHYVDTKSSPQRQYISIKLYKHLGFLMEALIEAFPQSILQLTAIVFYDEPNWISITSILISMGSVCSKVFLLSIAGNLTSWKMKLFVWLSFVVDFVGIFFVVSFAFYRPPEDGKYFADFLTFYLWEMMICIVPFTVLGSIGLHIYWTIKLSVERNRVCCPCFFLMISLLWIIGVFITMLSMTIFCCLWGALAVIGMSTSSRMPWNQTQRQFYLELFKWILDEPRSIHDVRGQLVLSQREDRILRLCVLNKHILEQHSDLKSKGSASRSDPYSYSWANYPDSKLLQFLNDRKSEHFQGVSYSDLRRNSDSTTFEPSPRTYSNKRRPSGFIPAFYYEVYAAGLTEFQWKLNHRSNTRAPLCYHGIAVITLFYLTWIAGPIYVTSRFLNVTTPLLMAIYLYVEGDGIVIVEDVDLFQVTMWCIYCILLTVWFVLAFAVLRDVFILWHILPSTGYLKGARDQPTSDAVMKAIKENYEELALYSVIKDIVAHRFGSDVAVIVMMYFNSIELEAADSSNS